MLRLIAKIDDSIINKFAKQRKTDSRKINFLKFISNISNGGFIWLLLAAVLVLIPDTREYGLGLIFLQPDLIRTTQLLIKRLALYVLKEKKKSSVYLCKGQADDFFHEVFSVLSFF